MKAHTGAKPFHCSLCDKSFTQPGSLNTHMRLHTGERPYACPVCPKLFTQASSLSMHMRQHRRQQPPNDQQQSPGATPNAPAVGNKQFQCPVCLKCYSSAAYLTKHVEAHGIAGVTVQRPSRLLRRLQHQRVQQLPSAKPQPQPQPQPATQQIVPCPLCERQVSGGAVALLLHIGRDHRVSKPMQCWECTAVFTDSAAFMAHLREHTERQAQRL